MWRCFRTAAVRRECVSTLCLHLVVASVPCPWLLPGGVRALLAGRPAGGRRREAGARLRARGGGGRARGAARRGRPAGRRRGGAARGAAAPPVPLPAASVGDPRRAAVGRRAAAAAAAVCARQGAERASARRADERPRPRHARRAGGAAPLQSAPPLHASHSTSPRACLQDFLLAFQGVLVVVSHDRYFVDKASSQLVERSTASPEQAPGTCPQVCSQLFVLGGDGDVRRWPDSFTRWVEWYRLQDQQRAF